METPPGYPKASDPEAPARDTATHWDVDQQQCPSPGVAISGQPYAPQPFQQQYQPTVVGIPVLGGGALYIYQHPLWGPDVGTRDSRFACCAWVTFALGLFGPIFWVISVMLPCCLPGANVQRAATASLIAAIFYAILAIVLAPSLTARYP